MSSAKEGAHAFMPSSNDSLFATVNGTRFPRPVSNSSSQSPSAHLGDELVVTNHLPNESAIISPPSANNQSDGSLSPTDMSALPSRRFVSSASSLPSSDVRSATDQTFWHDHYKRALEVHNRERALWEEEKGFLERQIANLKQELRARRSNSHNSIFNSKENDKVYPDAEVIRQAQEKLRTLSNASIGGASNSNSGTSGQDHFISSAHTVRNNSQDVSPGRENSARGSATFPPTTTTGNQLTSISENGPSISDTPRRVSISEISTTIVDTSSATTLAEEQPPSPPTSAWAATPPHARTYAGKTPPIPLSANDGTLDSSHHVVNDLHDAILDDDPELSSPKQLPSSPQNGSADQLSDLNKKLEQVAADPEANLPEVVRSTGATPDASSTSPSTVPKQGERGEVRLKTRRSLNFGAPLGAPLRDQRRI